MDFLMMAPYPIFFRALKTSIMLNFMLLTESEQFKHISALLLRGGGQGFTAATINMALSYVHRKIEEK